MNRDTLYSAAVFDLDAGPVTDAARCGQTLYVFADDQLTIRCASAYAASPPPANLVIRRPTTSAASQASNVAANQELSI
jgi:hypothetical protein